MESAIKLPKNESLHRVGQRNAVVLKVNEKWMQILVINSAWENEYHLIAEDLESKNITTKCVHKLVTRQQLLMELNYDEQAFEKLLNEI